jgi:osmoprotectant transport system permease protein
MIGTVLRWLTTPDHWTGPDGIPVHLLEHLEYALIAVVVAAVLALPAGLVIGHTGRGTVLVATLANTLRALPTLGLLVLVVIELAPRITSDAVYLLSSEVVLVLLAVPSILSSTYAGVQNLPPATRDAAEGMGMTGSQVLLRVELPCALPLILSGVRAAMLQCVATATVAAVVSLGGLGRPAAAGLPADGEWRAAGRAAGPGDRAPAGAARAVRRVAGRLRPLRPRAARPRRAGPARARDHVRVVTPPGPPRAVPPPAHPTRQETP